jgi:transposase
VEILSRLVQGIRLVRPQIHERRSGFLLHDNARPHTAASLTAVSRKKGDPRIEFPPPPPYSPDLSLPDVFLFPKIKPTLKGRRFEDTENTERNVTKELLAVHGNGF